MKKIQLSNSDLYVQVDDEDYELVKDVSWRLVAKRYASGRHSSWDNTRLMHRVIMKPSKLLDIDHINGDGLNNQRSNLRVVTHSENAANRAHKNVNNKSGFRGVHWCNTQHKWRAKINIDGKRVSLKYWDTATDAAKAYNQAAIKRYGDMARLNEV